MGHRVDGNGAEFLMVFCKGDDEIGTVSKMSGGFAVRLGRLQGLLYKGFRGLWAVMALSRGKPAPTGHAQGPRAVVYL